MSRLGPARAGPRGDGVRSPEPHVLGRRVREQGRRAGGGSWRRSREPDALPAIVYAGTRSECDRLSRASRPRARRRGDRLPRGSAARRARRGAAALHGRRGAGRRRHQRVRDGRGQGRRADRLPRVRAVVDRGLLPGGRPRGARRAAGALPAVRHRARQGPARLLHRALGGRRGPAEGHGAHDRALGRGRAAALQPAPQRARERGRGGRGARRRRLPGAGGRDPAGAVGARSGRGSRRRRVGPRTPWPPARPPPRRARSVRWRQYRSVWAWVEGDGLPAPRHPAPLRRPLGARAHGSLLRRLRSRRRSRGARGAVRQSTLAPAADLDSRDPRRRRARRARRRPHALRGDPPRRALEGRSTKHSYDGLPDYGAYRDLRADDVLAAIDALLAAGRLRATTARFPKLEAARPFRPPRGRPRERSPPARRRPRLRRGHQPPGDPGQRPRPRGGGRRRRVRQAGRGGARARASRSGSPRASSRSPSTPTARRATRDRRVAGRPRRRARRARGLHAARSAPRSSPRSRCG